MGIVAERVLRIETLKKVEFRTCGNVVASTLHLLVEVKYECDNEVTNKIPFEKTVKKKHLDLDHLSYEGHILYTG